MLPPTPNNEINAISRSLTRGELRYAFSVFGTSLDYNRVKVHNTKAYFFQPSDKAITPNGEVYFPPESYIPDFSVDYTQAAWLIHELTHAWQHQQGMWVRSRRMAMWAYNYGDLAKTKWTLTDYGIEQQASIVEDYFRKRHGFKTIAGTGKLEDYIRVIPFIPGIR